jgi:isopenicillin N synthase-like dioxygenase
MECFGRITKYILVGVLQVVNHSIRNSLIDGIKRVGKEFFQIPLEEKQKYAVKPGDLEGYGQTFVASEEQKLDLGDLLGLLSSPSDYKDLNAWPVQPTDFRCTSNIYFHGGKYHKIFLTVI